MSETETFRKRVRRGAKKLDKIDPDWPYYVDFASDVWDFNDETKCAVGQVAVQRGTYYSVLVEKMLGPSMHEYGHEKWRTAVRRNGFSLGSAKLDARYSDAMRDAWQEEAYKRINKAAYEQELQDNGPLDEDAPDFELDEAHIKTLLRVLKPHLEDLNTLINSPNPGEAIGAPAFDVLQEEIEHVESLISMFEKFA